MISIPVGIGDNGECFLLHDGRGLVVCLTVTYSGVPFSMGIIQTAWKEHLLVKFGSAIEDLIGGRSIPKFRNLEAKNYMYVGIAPDTKDRVEGK